MHQLPSGAHCPAALDPVPGVRVQMAQPQPLGYRVGAGLYLDKAHEHGFLVLALEHPGILIAAVQSFEPVQVSKLDQRTDLFIKSDFLCHIATADRVSNGSRLATWWLGDSEIWHSIAEGGYSRDTPY